MTEILLTGWITNVIYLLVVLLVTRMAVRFIARRTDTNLNVVMERINAEPMAAAVFWGLTGLSICVVAAAFAG